MARSFLSIHWTFSAPGAQLGWTAVWKAHSLAPIILGSAVLSLKGSFCCSFTNTGSSGKGQGAEAGPEAMASASCPKHSLPAALEESAGAMEAWSPAPACRKPGWDPRVLSLLGEPAVPRLLIQGRD